MQLDKITQGLKQEIPKVEPTPLDDIAIRKSISERNTPIVIALPHSVIRFKKSKTKEEQENPAE